jgi:hypothetical protein
MIEPRPLDRDSFDRLARHRGNPSFSAFIPTEQKGAQIEQVPISLKNARTAIDARLEERGVDSSVRERLTEPIRAAEDDREFWQRQGDSLAVFGASDASEMIRLAYPLDGGIRVDDRFHLRPLLRGLADNRTPLLALSMHDVRMFTVSNGHIEERPYAGPTSIDDVNWFEDKESRQQTHATGRLNAGFHGHDPEDRGDESRMRFLREVAAHVADSVPAGTRVLVMAVEEHWGPYSSVAHHDMHDFAVHGSPDGLTAARILEQVAPALDRIAGERIAAIDSNLDDGRSAGRYEEDPVAITRAALEGRVETLVIGAGAPLIPASVDEDQLTVSVDESGPHELLDEAVRHSWSNGGEVHAVDVIQGGAGDTAAVLRY